MSGSRTRRARQRPGFACAFSAPLSRAAVIGTIRPNGPCRRHSQPSRKGNLMATARYVEFDSLLSPEELDRLIEIVHGRAPYPTYGEGRIQQGFGAGIPQRYDAASNFIRTRAGSDT